MRYAIFEGNMERLEKKMIRIKNKCQKFGCDFHYEKVGEEYREIKDADGNDVTAKFILIDAEGIAKVNGWRFIASVDINIQQTIPYTTHPFTHRGNP